jgi:hypothetical protein
VVERVDSQICSSKIIERIDGGNLSDRLLVTMQTYAVQNRQ